MCDKKIIRDRTRLDFHLRHCEKNSNKLSLEDYFQQYIASDEMKIASGQLDLIEDNSLSELEKREILTQECDSYNVNANMVVVVDVVKMMEG